jgi:hypothetical protein
MISRVSATITKGIEDLIRKESTHVGLLEYPPLDMSSYTECRSQGYVRQLAEWGEPVRAGFLVIRNPLKFVGLDVPVTVMAIGLFAGPGAVNGLTAWGALEQPLSTINGVITVGGGTISVRIS